MDDIMRKAMEQAPQYAKPGVQYDNYAVMLLGMDREVLRFMKPDIADYEGSNWTKREIIPYLLADMPMEELDHHINRYNSRLMCRAFDTN